MSGSGETEDKDKDLEFATTVGQTDEKSQKICDAHRIRHVVVTGNCADPDLDAESGSGLLIQIGNVLACNRQHRRRRRFRR